MRGRPGAGTARPGLCQPRRRTGPRRPGRVDPGRSADSPPTTSETRPDWPLSGSAERRLVAGGAHQAESSLAQLFRQARGHAGGDRCFRLGPGQLSRPRSPAPGPDHRAPSGTSPGPVDPIGVDGCGAPVFATTARAMGRAFARLSIAGEFLEIFDAMHAFPALVSGVGNVDAAIATQLDAVAKRGAAGALGIGLRGRLGIGGQGLGRFGSGRRGGRSGCPRSIGGFDALCPGAARTALASRRSREAGKPVGRFEPRLELRWQ